MATDTSTSPPEQTASNDPPATAKKKNKSKEKKSTSVSKPKFKGETSEMNGSIFETSEESKDPTQFVRTLEALERFSYKTYKTDLSSVFEQPTGTTPSIPRPTAPDPSTADAYDKEAFTIKVKAHIAEEKQLLVDMKALWSVVWGQCSATLVSKLLDEEKVQTWKKQGDVVSLLQAIRLICMKYTVRTNPEVNLHKHIAFFYSYKQRDNDSIHKCFELFKLMADGIHNFGGNIGRHDLYIRRQMERKSLITQSSTHEEYAEAFSKLDAAKKDEVLKAAEAKSLAVAFLMGGKPNQYEDLILTLQNQYLLKNDLFPNSLTESYNLMSNFLAHSKKAVSESTVTNSKVYSLALSFLQRRNLQIITPEASSSDVSSDSSRSDSEPSSSHSSSSTISGHISSENSSDASSIGSTDTVGFCFMSMSRYRTIEDSFGSLKSTWILLDTQSNCDIFRNKQLLHDIREKPNHRLVLKSNGNGDIRTNMIGTIKGYGDVWYNPQSMANILSFANVRRKFRISISTGPDDPCPSFCVHKHDGSIMEFKEHALGLYIYDAAANKSNCSPTDKLEPVSSYSFLSTVVNNEENYSSRELNKAKNALLLYRRLGRPAPDVFMRLLRDNIIRNCDVSPGDAKLAFHIYGKDPATLMGKTKRMKPPPVPPLDPVPIPSHVLSLYKKVTISIDVFWLNGQRFLHSISDHIQLRTVEFLANADEAHLAASVATIINLYTARGFEVVELRGDGQFSCLKEHIRPVHLYTAAKGEHIPQIERSVQTIEGDCRTIYHGLPYTYFPPLMLRSLVQFVTQLRNIFPVPNGVSSNLGPTSIVTGAPMPSAKHFSLEFGEYVYTHDNPTISNDINPPHSTPAIALLPANRNGGWYFMSLVTGLRILRYKWDVLPVTTDVIYRVHQLARPRTKSKKKQREYDSFTFEWAPGIPVQPLPVCESPPLLGAAAISGPEQSAQTITFPSPSPSQDLNDSDTSGSLNLNDSVATPPHDLNDPEDACSHDLNGHEPVTHDLNDHEPVNPDLIDQQNHGLNDHDNEFPVLNEPEIPNSDVDDITDNNITDLQSTSDGDDDVITSEVSPLLQHDLIEQQLNDDLLFIQNLEDEFVDESQQLASELNNFDLPEADIANTSDDSDNGFELRSAPSFNSTTDDELRSVQDSTIDSEIRSEEPPTPPRSEHYDLRPNPRRTSESTFDAEHYKYSFLQRTKESTNAVQNLIDQISDAWTLGETDTENEHSKIIKDGINANLSDDHCRQVVAQQLKRIMNEQAYQKNRLHTSLIQLIHNKLFPYPKETSDNNNHTNVCLTQMSAKKGIERFGERALQAIITEYEQFENLSVFTPISLKHLSPSDRKLALHAIDLIKKKRTGKLKGRTVADGRK